MIISSDLVSLVVSLVLLQTCTAASVRLRQSRALSSMTREDLSEAGQLLDDIDEYFFRAQSLLCNQNDVSEDMSNVCSSLITENSVEDEDRADVFSVPLKRSSQAGSDSEVRRLLQDIVQKREGLEKLKRFIREYDMSLNAIAEQKKRACHQGYNGYGSNCHTERVLGMAHLRDAIKGGPGRKRRSVTMETGKL